MTSKKNGHKDHSGRAATGGAGTTPAVTTEPLDVDGKPESAVVKAIQNRIRNLTKRLRKIEAIEAKGVTLSKEQVRLYIFLYLASYSMRSDVRRFIWFK